MGLTSSTGPMYKSQAEFLMTGATIPLGARQERLLALKKMIIENADELADLVFQDVNWPKEKTMNDDIPFILKEIDYILKNHVRWIRQKVRQSPEGCIDQPMPVDWPLGVVLIITAAAEPLRSALAPLVSVIAAGNTAILWQQSCPTCGQNTIDKLDSLLPNYIQPEVCCITKISTWNPLAMLSVLRQPFNYTICTGKMILGELMLKFTKPLSLEIMGKHFVVVAEDFWAEGAAELIFANKWLNMEEDLDNTPDLIITVSSIKEELLAKMKEASERQSVNVVNDDIYRKFSRIGNERQFDRLTNALAETKGEIIFQCGDSERETLFFPPTLVDVKKGDPLLAEEIYGPVLPVISFDSLDEAKKFVNEDLQWRVTTFLSLSQKTQEDFRNETSSGGFCSSRR